MIKAVLFDLDGTLLPMDQDVFVKAYFGGLAKKLAPHGYDPKTLIDAIWQGTAAMVNNGGSCTNEEAFWNRFAALMGADVRKDEPIFDAFYRKEFQAVQQVCGFSEAAAQVVALVKEKGCMAVLATNPIFPAVATQSRIRWAGLQPEDFSLYTTYENSHHCKPNPAYYLEILEKLELKAEECIMVGNDVGEDMIAGQLGMEVFLLTDCLINKQNVDIAQFPNGGFPQLLAFLRQRL